MSSELPRTVMHVGVPPIKCQGIKTKLIPFILESIQWNPGKDGHWVEPFMGSGCVAFNVQPDRALLCDTNKHIINFYHAIQSGTMSEENIRAFLELEGQKLSRIGEEYYYEVRNRFNTEGSVFDFIFLNRACFNGVMRFNRHGKFNVPFGHKPERFAKAYITKIANQINWAAKQMRGREWEFRVSSWRETLSVIELEDFVYMDPPYIGRHADYFNQWNEKEAEDLAVISQKLPCGFALSMWLENKYRKNEHVDEFWGDLERRTCGHFYHVGSDESLRNEMEEALLICPGFATPDRGKQQTRRKLPEKAQLSLFLENKCSYGTMKGIDSLADSD